MTVDAELTEANWSRMRKALNRAATEHRRTADALDGLSFNDPKGNRRTPEAVISEAALTVNSGPDHLMIHQLAIWAETINEIQRHPIKGGRDLCDYKITDPDTECILAAGHSIPTDDGLLVHVAADGVMFA